MLFDKNLSIVQDGTRRRRVRRNIGKRDKTHKCAENAACGDKCLAPGPMRKMIYSELNDALVAIDGNLTHLRV
jgi:hypothetical protein